MFFVSFPGCASVQTSMWLRSSTMHGATWSEWIRLMTASWSDITVKMVTGNIHSTSIHSIHTSVYDVAEEFAFEIMPRVLQSTKQYHTVWNNSVLSTKHEFVNRHCQSFPTFEGANSVRRTFHWLCGAQFTPKLQNFTYLLAVNYDCHFDCKTASA